MARQEVDIGVQGNDGTGDSIREAFRKVNDNFRDLYAVFGLGGQINLNNLDDAPPATLNYPSGYGPHQVLMGNDAGDNLEAREIVSGTGIAISYDQLNDPDQTKRLIISSTSSTLSTDATPTLGGPLNANGNVIAKVAFPDSAAVTQFNAVHGPLGTTITTNDIVITKGYADATYVLNTTGGSSGQLRVRDEPLTPNEYTKTVSNWANDNAIVTAHGFTPASDGLEVTFNTTGTPPVYTTDLDPVTPVSLVNGNSYYIKYATINELSLYPTALDAKNGTNQLYINGLAATGTQTLVDAAYDSTLSGNWVSNEALPRKSVVRRQGDTMEGALYLYDHPGTLAGSGTPNGSDDLQAATKYYVDNSSFASTTNLFVSTAGDDSQANTPPGKEGRAFAYAYSTIGAACLKAADIIDVAATEPGPYRQKLVYTIATVQYSTRTTAVAFSGGPTNYSNAKATLDANREFIRAQTIAYINNTYPTFIYNEDTCSRDIGLIIDAIGIDIITGGNYQSINAGKRYFKNASAQIASGSQQVQTLAGINYAKQIAVNLLNGLTIPTLQTVYTQQPVVGVVTAPMITTVGNNFDIITGYITNGLGWISAPAKSFGAGIVSLTFSNGGNGYVDQGNPTNRDIIAGKIVRGLISGATGRIISYTPGATTDVITCQLLGPTNFIVSEELEYAEPNKDIQITIRIESGIYYEDYPIRVPANVSIKGDEFRRTIIRPKNRTSQSPWVDIYFYRDTTFDGLTLTTTNYGRHYLKDPTKVYNVGPYTGAGSGGYNNAAKLILINKEFIKAEVNAYITATYPLVVYDTVKSARDIGIAVDSVVEDLINGGKAASISAGARFYGNVLGAATTACLGGMTRLEAIVQQITQNQTVTPSTGNTVTQIKDLSITRETGTGTIITSLINTIRYGMDPANTTYNPPKNNDEIDVFLVNDAFKLHNTTNQGHGGFVCVLDPFGSIGSKSPYIQSCASFSKSINAQTFAGGMYIDGFAGRLQCTITAVSGSNLILDVSGLIREPNTPTSFYVSGIRYQVDTLTAYDPVLGTATLKLNSSTPWAGGNISITLETPGNRSMLANDFTQVNDLGYGVVATNGALTEQVSTYTYYCYTAYFANKGGQVRSVAGSNAHGVYGLRAEGSDPVEVADPIYLSGDLVNRGQVYRYGSVVNTGSTGELTFYLKRYGSVPLSISEIEIYRNSSQERYEIRSVETTGIRSNSYTHRVVGATQANPCVISTPASVSISAITKASPAVVTTGTHNLVDGDFIRITGAGGMTQINSRNYYVDVLSPTTFGLYADSSLTVPIDSTNYTTYTTGGTGSLFHTFHSGDRVTFASVGGMTQLNGNQYYVKSLTTTTFSLYTDSALTTPVNSTAFGAYTSGGTVTDGVTYSINSASKANPCQITTSVAHNYANGDYVTISGVTGMTEINVSCYVKVINTTTLQLYSDSTLTTTINSSNYTTYVSGGTIVGGQEVLKITLNTSGNNNTLTTGLTSGVFDDQNIAIRALQNFRFTDVLEVKPTRPSTALEFLDTVNFLPPSNLYRIIAYSQLEPTGAALGTNVAIVTTDSSFIYVKPITDPSKITTTDPIDPTKKMGSQIGDIRIAVDPTSLSADGITACTANKWIFYWAGKIHRITGYTAAAGLVPAYISIADVFDNNTVPSLTGIAEAFPTSLSSPYTIRAGLPSSVTGQVTVKISTVRVNGHDFLDIGTGGYNTTNYPNLIFGSPTISKTGIAGEVKEATKGRVFYASTDQDGIFRVGPYFKVDQGTGSVTFSASISLSNLDGLGFKRGVVVSEFSTDATMTNNSTDTVSTQSAVRGYIDRRLGLDHSGGAVPLVNLVGPGYLALNGNLAMKGNLNMAGYKIQNLGAPTTISDAVTKGYVDTLIAGQNQLSELTDVSLSNFLDGDVLAYQGGTWRNASMVGDVTVTYDSTANNISTVISNSAITNAKVSASAAIDQSKLNLTNATAGANAGASTKGIASFDSANFDASSGWIGIKAQGVAYAEIQNVGGGAVLGNLTGSAATVTELTPESILKRATWNEFNGSATLNQAYAYTFTKGGTPTATEALSSFGITSITTSGGASSLVKTDVNGIIDVKGVKINSSSGNILDVTGTTTALNTSGGITIVSGTGSANNSTPVTYNGQWSPGTNATLSATTATTATNVTGGAAGSLLYQTAAATTTTLGIGSATNVLTVNAGATAPQWTAQSSLTVGSAGSATNATNASNVGITNDTSSTTAYVTFVTATSGNNSVRVNSNMTYNASTNVLTTTATQARFADLAEYYTSDQEYEPGTVLIFGGVAETTITSTFGDTRLAGVVSTRPAYAMNVDLSGTRVCIALQGRVPCKVVGRVKKGDMLTTAGIAGHAAKAIDPKVGTIIGKALEDKDYSEAGVIEIAVGRV